MTGQEILSPVTPLSWIMARLREHQPLLKLLGDGPFPGDGPLTPTIYQAGEVPRDHPARFVVVKPPLRHVLDHFANLTPRKMDASYLVWAETQSDKLPPGLDLDGVLEPIYCEIVRALRHLTTPEAAGGKVLQVEILDAYTPRPIELTETIKVKQWGVQLALISVT